jgi:hypothetical protein
MLAEYELKAGQGTSAPRNTEVDINVMSDAHTG